jgi:hypothetical protein
MAGILAAYLSFLTKHPLTGNMAQSAVSQI